MQQKNSMQQSRRTRNQRKRELRRIICMSFALLLLWMMLCTVLVKAWLGHPAEQPVNYAEHMETILVIGGDSHGNLQE